jgi:glycosyltransferase involved in cell wall biosynthesis
MRILICASSAPLPPMNGFRLLVAALERELRRGHTVTTVALLRKDQARPVQADRAGALVTVPPPPDGPMHVAAGLATASVLRRPLNADRLADAIAPHVLERCRKFQPDVALVASGRLAALGRRLHGLPRVLLGVDARHLNIAAKARLAGPVRAAALRDEAGRVIRAMNRDYADFHRVVVVTEEDRRAVLDVAPSLDVVAIPNGVDTDVFRPDRHAPTTDRIVFTGTMDYAPNEAAAELLATRILPRLRTTHPEIELALVGRNPSAAVRRLDGDGVIVTGEVPDVRPWLTSSRVFVAPMTTGTGVKNKVLEAMACGCPTVLTSLAAQGLSCQAGRDVVVRDGIDAFAAAVRDLLSEPRAAARLGRAARDYVLRQHSWPSVAERYAAVLEQAVSAAEPLVPR